VGRLVVASFNLHAGVDGWGTPFDPVAACASLHADVIVLQESFSPEVGTSLADQIAGALGYQAISVPLAPARLRRLDPPEGPPDRWGPSRSTRTRCLRLELPSAPRRGRPSPKEQRQGRGLRGTWDLAVLTRLRVTSTEAIPLPALRRDGLSRQLLRVDLEGPEGTFSIAATHLAHLSAGSPVQIRALGRLLSHLDHPAALLGDMNCFGPPLVALLPGWRRAVRGRSWPSWRPCCQPDHVLVNRHVTTAQGDVLALGGSDHLPVRAALTW